VQGQLSAMWFYVLLSLASSRKIFKLTKQCLKH